MKNLGMILLGIWLIAMGLKATVQLGFAHDTLVYGILAIAAGVLVLLRR